MHHDSTPERDGQQTDSPAPPLFRLLEAGRYINQGQSEFAISLLEVLRGEIPPSVEPVRLRYLAIASNHTGRPARALLLAGRASRMAQTSGDQEEAFRADAVCASAHSRRNHHKQAVPLLRACVTACEQGTVEDDTFHFGCLVALASAFEGCGRTDDALEVLERAIELSELFGTRAALADLYATMARGRLARGQEELAIFYKQRSSQIYEDMRRLNEISVALERAAMLCMDKADFDRAQTYRSRAALVAAQSVGVNPIAGDTFSRTQGPN